MGTKSNDLDLITVYLDEIGRFKKLTEDEEKDLISRLEQGEVKAKEEIFKKYCDSLVKGGALFIGSTEQIINYAELGYKRMNSFFYEKV